MRGTNLIRLTAAVAALALSAQAAADATRRNPKLPGDASCAPFASLSKRPQAVETAAPAPAPPRLLEGLGYAGLEPDTDNEQARIWFAQGERLMWAFDEAEAVRAFREAQRLDPTCALCFVGES